MVYPFSRCKACDRLFQKTNKAGQFDISTSMLFLTNPKYHVRIVHGLRNHFPNTTFGGVLLWTLIEVLLRNMRSLYSLWRQKTPLTNGQVQEAKTRKGKRQDAGHEGPCTQTQSSRGMHHQHPLSKRALKSGSKSPPHHCMIRGLPTPWEWVKRTLQPQDVTKRRITCSTLEFQ